MHDGGECYYPDNVEVSLNWYSKLSRPVEKPFKLNKDNNCKWFKEHDD